MPQVRKSGEGPEVLARSDYRPSWCPGACYGFTVDSRPIRIAVTSACARLAAPSFSAVGTSPGRVSDVLDKVDRFVWSFPEIEVLRVAHSWMEEEET